MAQFLLFFGFRGSSPRFFSLSAHFFPLFGALVRDPAFFSRFSFLLPPTYGAFPAGRYSRPLSRPFYAFLFFFTSFPGFSGRAGFSGAPFSGNVPESRPAFFRRLFSRFSLSQSSASVFAARLPNARSGAFFCAEARFSRRADCLYRAAANPFLRRFFAVFATFRRRAYFRLCRGILFA